MTTEQTLKNRETPTFGIMSGECDHGNEFIYSATICDGISSVGSLQAQKSVTGGVDIWDVWIRASRIARIEGFENAKQFVLEVAKLSTTLVQNIVNGNECGIRKSISAFHKNLENAYEIKQRERHPYPGRRIVMDENSDWRYADEMQYEYLKTTDINDSGYEHALNKYLSDLKEMGNDTLNLQTPLIALMLILKGEAYSPKEKLKRQKEVLPHLEQAYNNYWETRK